MIRTELGWVKCAACEVTQPLTSLKATNGLRIGVYQCTDVARCSRNRVDLEAQRAEFARLHPVLALGKEISDSMERSKPLVRDALMLGRSTTRRPGRIGGRR